MDKTGRTGGRRHWLAVWLIILTVCVHALLPVGSPLTRASGSAFSAFTADVSLRSTGQVSDKAAVVSDVDPDQPAAAAQNRASMVIAFSQPPTVALITSTYPASSRFALSAPDPLHIAGKPSLARAPPVA